MQYLEHQMFWHRRYLQRLPNITQCQKTVQPCLPTPAANGGIAHTWTHRSNPEIAKYADIPPPRNILRYRIWPIVINTLVMILVRYLPLLGIYDP